MLLGLILLLSLFLHIVIPSIFMPLFFLGILSIYILARQYWTVFIWIFIIILILQVSSLTPWWQFSLYYLLWSLGVYISSISLDKGWPVQSIMANVSLMIVNLIFNGFNVDYINIGIYTIVNGIAIAIVLYIAEKLKIYEEFI
jgi:endonuclease/exonuclease/phosphatase (EEP) superfamily protein YafD